MRPTRRPGASIAAQLAPIVTSARSAALQQPSSDHTMLRALSRASALLPAAAGSLGGAAAEALTSTAAAAAVCGGRAAWLRLPAAQRPFSAAPEESAERWAARQGRLGPGFGSGSSRGYHPPPLPVASQPRGPLLVSAPRDAVAGPCCALRDAGDDVWLTQLLVRCSTGRHGAALLRARAAGALCKHVSRRPLSCPLPTVPCSISVTFKDEKDGTEKTVKAPLGKTLLEVRGGSTDGCCGSNPWGTWLLLPLACGMWLLLLAQPALCAAVRSSCNRMHAASLATPCGTAARHPPPADCARKRCGAGGGVRGQPGLLNVPRHRGGPGASWSRHGPQWEGWNHSGLCKFVSVSRAWSAACAHMLREGWRSRGACCRGLLPAAHKMLPSAARNCSRLMPLPPHPHCLTCRSITTSCRRRMMTRMTCWTWPLASPTREHLSWGECAGLAGRGGGGHACCPRLHVHVDSRASAPLSSTIFQPSCPSFFATSLRAMSLFSAHPRRCLTGPQPTRPSPPRLPRPLRPPRRAGPVWVARSSATATWTALCCASPQPATTSSRRLQAGRRRRPAAAAVVEGSTLTMQRQRHQVAQQAAQQQWQHTS